MAHKARKEFPRMVYGPGGQTARIDSEDERPDGWLNDFREAREKFDNDRSPEDGGGKESAGRAAKEQKAAEDSEKSQIREFLDMHNVEYSPNLGLAKLRKLSEELQRYLAEQASPQASEGFGDDEAVENGDSA